MKYDPTPLEKDCIKAFRGIRDKMDRERYALPRPRPKYLGPGNVRDQHDLAQVRAMLKVVMKTVD